MKLITFKDEELLRGAGKPLRSRTREMETFYWIMRQCCRLPSYSDMANVYFDGKFFAIFLRRLFFVFSHRLMYYAVADNSDQGGSSFAVSHIFHFGEYLFTMPRFCGNLFICDEGCDEHPSDTFDFLLANFFLLS